MQQYMRKCPLEAAMERAPDGRTLMGMDRQVVELSQRTATKPAGIALKLYRRNLDMCGVLRAEAIYKAGVAEVVDAITVLAEASHPSVWTQSVLERILERLTQGDVSTQSWSVLVRRLVPYEGRQKMTFCAFPSVSAWPVDVTDMVRIRLANVFMFKGVFHTLLCEGEHSQGHVSSLASILSSDLDNFDPITASEECLDMVMSWQVACKFLVTLCDYSVGAEHLEILKMDFPHWG